MSRNARKTEVMKQNAIRFAAIAAVAMACACLPSTMTAQQHDASQQAIPTSNASPTEQPKGKSFAKPGEAAAALYAAAKRDDDAELLVILGPDAKEIVQWSNDPDERRQQRAMFAQKYEVMHRLVREPDSTVALYVGAENWPLPIPLVKFHGAWYFDADLGGQEVRYRRIGRNEMEALEVCRTLVDAEKEYQSIAHQYTAKFVSSNGTKDGLYWKSADDSTRSPIGPYLAHAGIGESGGGSSMPFHGYFYRIVMHGSDNYSILAFPAEYRSSGVMTFLVKPDGTAYEKDFGDQTATLSKPPASSDSDSSWKKVE
jgi:hypothetical protein